MDELIRQRDSITSHLDQLRQLLGSMPIPGLDKLTEGQARAARPTGDGGAAPAQAPHVPTAAELAAELDATIVLPDEPDADEPRPASSATKVNAAG